MPRSLQILVAFIVSLFLGRAVTIFYEIRKKLTGLMNESKTVAYWLSTWSHLKEKEKKLVEVQQLFARWAITALKIVFFEATNELIDGPHMDQLLEEGYLTHPELESNPSLGRRIINAA